MQPIKTNYRLYLLLCLLIFVLQKQVYSQIVIGSPILGFSQACASDNFNNYTATFVFSPDSGLETSNQFSLELSNANGDFSNANTVYTSNPGDITTSPAKLNFSLPTTTSGENYRIRIKSSAPIATSSASIPFAAYYKIQDLPFSINNLVATGAYCEGGSYLLTIDNPDLINNDSPLNYPSLTFKWFKKTSPTTSVFVADGQSLNVNQEGIYFVETNYGTCTSNSFSNRVTVSSVITGEIDTSISSSLGNPFCPLEDPTILSTAISADTYQWFKDGESIDGATSQVFETFESGTYAVEANLGTCTAYGEIDLVSELFQASINVDEVNTIEDGEILSVNISSTANSPIYKWYLDNTLITEANSSNFDASASGNYEVIVTESSGCESSISFFFEINITFDSFPDVENIPNLISPNGDNINDTWVIPTKYITGTNTQITILSNNGSVALETNNYLNNWPTENLNLTSFNKVFYYVITTTENEIKKGSITIIK